MKVTNFIFFLTFIKLPHNVFQCTKSNKIDSQPSTGSQPSEHLPNTIQKQLNSYHEIANNVLNFRKSNENNVELLQKDLGDIRSTSSNQKNTVNQQKQSDINKESSQEQNPDLLEANNDTQSVFHDNSLYSSTSSVKIPISEGLNSPEKGKSKRRNPFNNIFRSIRKSKRNSKSGLENESIDSIPKERTNSKINSFFNLFKSKKGEKTFDLSCVSTNYNAKTLLLALFKNLNLTVEDLSKTNKELPAFLYIDLNTLKVDSTNHTIYRFEELKVLGNKIYICTASLPKTKFPCFKIVFTQLSNGVENFLRNIRAAADDSAVELRSWLLDIDYKSETLTISRNKITVFQINAAKVLKQIAPALLKNFQKFLKKALRYDYQMAFNISDPSVYKNHRNIIKEMRVLSLKCKGCGKFEGVEHMLHLSSKIILFEHPNIAKTQIYNRPNILKNYKLVMLNPKEFLFTLTGISDGIMNYLKHSEMHFRCVFIQEIELGRFLIMLFDKRYKRSQLFTAESEFQLPVNSPYLDYHYKIAFDHNSHFYLK